MPRRRCRTCPATSEYTYVAYRRDGYQVEPKSTPKIKDRITAALAAPPMWHSYHDLMADVFPPKEYPKAWNYGCNGGPPGCAMAFGRALREMREAKLIEHNFNGRGYSGDYVYRLCEKK